MNLATAFIDGGPIYQDLKDLDFSKSPKISSLFSTELDSKSAFHNLIIEEHNWVVDQMQKTFPDASADLIFEEARKFVIAEIQHITFEEFLPIVLGEETMVFFIKFLKIEIDFQIG